METELAVQVINTFFFHFYLVIIMIFQWTTGSSSSEELFLLETLQQKMSCGKTTSEATHADAKVLRSQGKFGKVVSLFIYNDSPNK